MIVTRNWLQEFIDISKISTEDICKALNSIGLEVDSLEKISIPSKVVLGKVLEKEKHPDADKLNICQVDIGTEQVQIVCGAKNVDAGQYVPVAINGCNLGGGFKIKKAKLRGVESNGMICSSTEIGMAKLNDGILELDDSIGELIIGKELCEYPLLNDEIIEIELTANRGDCLSIAGVARELSAFYNIPLNEFENHSNFNDFGIGQVLEVECENKIDTSLVFKAIDFSEFKLSVLQKIRVGIIDKYQDSNDIANILSYVTHCTGVILNAYPKEKAIKKGDLSIIHVKKDTQGFDNTYGTEHLSKIGIEHNKIEANETNFIIEASYVNPELVSKKVFETKIKTGDIYYRTSRGSEPDIEYGINYFTSIVSDNGALIYKGSESFVEEEEKIALDVNVNKINSIIGQNIEKTEIERILTSLQFEVKDTGDNILVVKIPQFRHDIKNIADVTEEIVRIIGIDNIIAKPLAIDEVNRVNKTSLDLVKKNRLRAKAIENGFYETLTYVFSSKENLEKYGFKTVKDNLDILNPIVKELNTFRSTILLNLVEACSNNFKNGARSTAFFEIGTVFDENRNESKKISFIQTGAIAQEDVSNSGKPENIDFFSFAKKILNTVGKFDLETLENIQNDFVHPYQSAKVIIEGKEIGYISKLHPSVCEDYDLGDTFIAELDFDALKNDLVKTQSYSKFQASKKDLSIIAPKDLEYKKIKDVINSLNDKRIKQFNLIDIYSDEKLGENESLTIRFVLQDDEKTMEEEDILTSMNSILDALDKKLSIGLRQ
ncbi:phenylalanine--tRNA ligase beta subunit [Malaciobacter pacificus]|uniref:Phenylalanine--tRNA ligase beta subunit n=1 Tax=Malaciobacter pacificus TaxID=1080223 RepID=A0A5C2H8D2_9BACT|nr:phenylalanine--tRNA ligase subunit beta [Malaciobacter pacificus]QEP33476.1 phenylalanyl-tRNA synthetase, beta subunit [Malaciobacter pacificus]GGD31838.1 phenylalanine--tRNA ligase beta subunit [Malaciobacter pacificus]